MENMPQEENHSTRNVSNSRNINPYILPASILLAAILVSGSVIYMVNSGKNSSDVSGKPVNPLSAKYKGPKTAFSECIDSGKYAATSQADNAAGAEAEVNSTPTTFVNGRKVVVKDANGKPAVAPDGSSRPQSVGANGDLIIADIEEAIKNPWPAPTTGPLALTSRDVIMGDPNAPVTVIEYGDYQCPFCELFYAQVQSVIEKQYVQTGKVKFVFRNFPFLGQESLDAGAAVECAKEQGKFWEYHGALYAAKTEDAQKYGGGENDGFLNRDMFLNLGQRVGLK